MVDTRLRYLAQLRQQASPGRIGACSPQKLPPLVQALVCMCFVLTCTCVATCPQDTGGTCIFFCDASKNAACAVGKCVCVGGACSDGSGACPTSAPISSTPIPTYDGICHDTTVPNVAGGEDRSADATAAISFHQTNCVLDGMINTQQAAALSVTP